MLRHVCRNSFRFFHFAPLAIVSHVAIGAVKSRCALPAFSTTSVPSTFTFEIIDVAKTYTTRELKWHFEPGIVLGVARATTLTAKMSQGTDAYAARVRALAA